MSNSTSRPMSRGEFISLIAMMFATIAFSVDSLLPALPEIGAELSPDALNNAQLVLSSFLIGMGLGTLVTGPLSDSFGRKAVIYWTTALYIAAAAAAYFAQSLELLLAARFVQGVGSAGPRVVAMAIVRDLYAGRDMARIMSFAMMIFTLVPAIAPALGAAIIAVAGWRMQFASFVFFAVVIIGWLWLRLPEPLAPEDRRPFRAGAIWEAIVELLGHASIRIAILVLAACFSMIFGMLTSVQQVYDISFGRGDSFPMWFGVVAILAGSASLLNASLVVRLGMRFLITVTLGVVLVASLGFILLIRAEPSDTILFTAFVAWQTLIFGQAGLTIGNLNALAMEPVGHIAGLAASAIGALATMLSMLIAVPMGLAFDGTPMPLVVGITLAGGTGLALMLYLKQSE